MDIRVATELLSDTRKGQMILADRTYDADWLRTLISAQGGWANISTRDQPKVANLLLAMALQTAQSRRALF